MIGAATIRLGARETDLIRHALGLRDGRTVSYRNHFTASPGGPDFQVWKGLVDRGLACGRPLSRHKNGFIGFRVKRAAAEAVLLPGEALDPEDFAHG